MSQFASCIFIDEVFRSQLNTTTTFHVKIPIQLTEELAMRVFTIAISISFLALTAFAQSNTGTLSGVVSDTSKAPIAGVSIQVKNVKDGTVFKALTGPAGNYSVSQLPPGTYELSAS